MRTPRRRAIILFLCMIIACSVIASQAVDEDSVLYIPNNQFLKDYWQKGFRDRIFNPPFGFDNIKISNKNGFGEFRFLQTTKNMYLTLNNTGRVYELVTKDDSVLTFRRIDQTVSESYNIGAFNFTQGENIFSYSGYGFWKTSGHLRIYNFKIREWDIVKLNKEIIPQLFPTTNIWYDSENFKLYTLFQRGINQGLKDNDFVAGKISDETYCLDLQKNDWELIGKTHPNIINIFKFAGPILNGNKALLVATTDHYIYWIDVINNLVYKLDKVDQSQTLLKLFNNSFCYLHDSTIYYYHYDRKVYDSLKIVVDSKKSESFPVFIKSKKLNTVSPYILFVIAIPIIVFLYFQTKKKKKENHLSEELFVKDSSMVLAPLEKNLVDLLLGKNGNPASIQEVNYVLGLKNKNIGLQKKVRSDVINSINEKYFRISGSKALLIQSIRSESDKRIFEYVIDMNRANEILGK